MFEDKHNDGNFANKEFRFIFCLLFIKLKSLFEAETFKKQKLIPPISLRLSRVNLLEINEAPLSPQQYISLAKPKSHSLVFVCFCLFALWIMHWLALPFSKFVLVYHVWVLVEAPL